MAAEAGSADIGINVAGNCRGDDSMDTSALEFGIGELGKRTVKGNEFSWAVETAVRKGESHYEK